MAQNDDGMSESDVLQKPNRNLFDDQPADDERDSSDGWVG